MDKSRMLIRLIEHYTNGNKAQFAKSLGVSAQTISAWISRNTFDAELIYAKCGYINPNWLLTGEGDMLIEDTDSVKYNTGINGDNNKNNSVNDSGTLHRLLTLLESKDKQIEEKDKQISTLLNIVQDAKK